MVCHKMDTIDYLIEATGHWLDNIEYYSLIVVGRNGRNR